jgi:diguanylate cyclase (GGDEF)-like protein
VRDTLRFSRSFILRPVINLACAIAGIPTYNQLEIQLTSNQDQIQTVQQQQQALYRVISKIRASFDLDNIFRTATKETCKLLHAERIAVYRFSAEWGGEFIEDFEFTQPGWNGPDIWSKNTVWNDSYLQEHQGGRYRHNECLVVNDIYKAGLSQCHIDILEQFYIRAYATAPIFIGTKLWGILAAYQHSKPRQWQEIEITFLSQVATQLGFAVQQAELITQLQYKAKVLQTANEKQLILSNLIAAIRESLDLSTLFQTTVREVRKVLKVDRVGIFKFDPESHYDTGKFVAENVLPEFDSTIAIRIKDHCFGEQYAAQYHQGRIQIIPDVFEANLKDCHLKVLQRFQIKSQVVVPLMKEDSLWGLLCVHNCRSPRQWQDTEIAFIQQLAAQFNVALSHANLLTQYRAKTEALDQTVDKLKEANRKLDELSHVDALTRIPNRRFFDEVLEEKWIYLGQHGKYLSLIFFDIDHFKAYNDYYGHIAGDEALTAVAQAVQSVLVNPSDFLARYGGEEFAVILPDMIASRAVEIARKIQAAVKQLNIPHQGIPQTNGIITVSLGITSQIPGPGQSPEILLEQADKALYQAKAEGRNTCCMFMP